jgi:hypothetical protein
MHFVLLMAETLCRRPLRARRAFQYAEISAYRPPSLSQLGIEFARAAYVTPNIIADTRMAREGSRSARLGTYLLARRGRDGIHPSTGGSSSLPTTASTSRANAVRDFKPVFP